jgi:hypothetical protein
MEQENAVKQLKPHAVPSSSSACNRHCSEQQAIDNGRSFASSAAPPAFNVVSTNQRHHQWASRLKMRNRIKTQRSSCSAGRSFSCLKYARQFVC